MSHRPRSAWLVYALRNLALASASALFAFALVSSPGCGTSAVGVDDCRDIEEARCDAARACGTVTDVTQCKLFYRDHCLHGFSTPAPARADVDACITTINNLTICANAFGGQDATLEQCPAVAAADSTRVCEVVAAPERAYACSFLAGKPVSAPPSAGGQGGQGGSE